MRGIIKGRVIVALFISIRGICNLMVSRQEETNLTSKFRIQGPNTNKRIMAAIPERVGTMF
jgi:hypothetical protein